MIMRASLPVYGHSYGSASNAANRAKATVVKISIWKASACASGAREGHDHGLLPSPGPEGSTLQTLFPDHLAGAIHFDDVVVVAGYECVAVYQPRHLRGAFRSAFPQAFAISIVLDNLVGSLVGNQVARTGKHIQAQSPPGRLREL